MAQIDGGTILARTFRAHDVTTVFTLHGGHLDGAFQALAADGVRLVDTRHEQAAGIAATGYARSTGKIGVAMVTAGGGVTNAVTAIANAYADCVASVFLGGAPPLRDFDALPVNSGYDQLSLMGGITKWAHRVTHVELIPYVLDRAFHLAREGRPGPVYVDLPSDVLFAFCDETKLTYPKSPRVVASPAPSKNAVDEALGMLRGAERPVILAGGGVAYSGASTELLRFAELSGIPVMTNYKARGALPTDHPLYAGGFATLAAASRRGAGEADVALVLGARFGIYTGGSRRSFLPDSTTVIQVDIKPEEIGRLRNVQLGIVADCREMLAALIERAGNGNWNDYATWVSSLCGPAAATAPASATGGDQIDPGQLAGVIAKLAPEDAIYVVDGGETPAWLDAVAKTAAPGRFLAHGYMGIMGEGMPLAVGAQVGNPNSRVICFTGDGAVGFNFAEFDTMVRHGLPIVVVVNNNRAWGMSSNGQDLLYGKGHRVVSDLAPTHYEIAASGFGAHAEYVDKIKDFPAAFSRALQSGKPACINVMTDPSVVHPITQRLMGLAAEGMRSSEGKARIPYADVLEV